MAKLTVADIISKVSSKVDESSFSNADILSALNQCNVHIATEIDIKELATVGEVTIEADESTVAFPDDYLKNFTFAYNKTTGDRVKVYRSRRLIDRKFRNSNTNGNILYAADDYPNIFVRYTPSSDQVLDIYYHALPDDLTADGNFPGYIPNNYIYNIYFNYACAQFYDFIEDGMEGEKVNTLYHMDLADKHIDKLRMFIGPDPDQPFMPDEVNFDFDFDDF